MTTTSRIKSKRQQIMVCSRGIRIPWLLDNQKWNPASSRKSYSNPNISAPTKKKELRRLIGMVNYYRDMWIRRSDVLASLAALTFKTTPWKWTDEHQRSFDLMKQIVSREMLLAYPDFSKPFNVYTDASHSQLGASICQNNKPIAFYLES
jgi:RNase H-like domain found in reverse transcriptase